MAPQLALLKRRLMKLSRILQDRDRFLATAWCTWKGTAFEPWARATDPALWAETLEVARQIKDDAARIIPGLPITGGQPGAGGGGGCDVRKLYFLARRVKPRVIVETGVSAGYSSRAFLEAIRANGFGRLYSSDLPVFLEPEQVGCLVPQALREHWELFSEGDTVNIPRIVNAVSSIDLFHYDSDKSASGKEATFSLVRPKMAADGVIVVDDIDRDAFFRRVAARWGGGVLVFRTVGVIGFTTNRRVDGGVAR
ncbi:MAG: O-methyltransferase [Vicinamibacterales bacterium]